MAAGRRPTSDGLDDAWRVVGRLLPPTPLLPAPFIGPNVQLELENLQPTESFKVRGRFRRCRASRNSNRYDLHRQTNLGVAFGAALMDVTATMVVPATAAPAKLACLSEYPNDIVQHEITYDQALAYAISLAHGSRIARMNPDRDA